MAVAAGFCREFVEKAAVQVENIGVRADDRSASLVAPLQTDDVTELLRGLLRFRAYEPQSKISGVNAGGDCVACVAV